LDNKNKNKNYTTLGSKAQEVGSSFWIGTKELLFHGLVLDP
jgi:hypothetical protein